MQSEQTMNYSCGELSIYPQLGEVKNSKGHIARLGPVNMKVLALLISKPQTLITRSEIFAAVWPNQEISDEALTRCISDIRSQLKALCPHEEFIETLPRRGYRWSKEVSEQDLQINSEKEVSNTLADEISTTPLASSKLAPPLLTSSAPPASASSNTANSLVAWLSRSVIYVISLVVIATVGVWLLNYFNKPNALIVAILPIESSPQLSTYANQLEEKLIEKILLEKELQILSKTAVESRPNNPFPYLYFEFGAQWVIENELKTVNETLQATLSLVDSRTGIILHQTSNSFPTDEAFHKFLNEEDGFVQAFIDHLVNIAES